MDDSALYFLLLLLFLLFLGSTRWIIGLVLVDAMLTLAHSRWLIVVMLLAVVGSGGVRRTGTGGGEGRVEGVR